MQNNTSVTIYWHDDIIYHGITNKFIIGEGTDSNFIFPIEKLGLSNWTLLDNNILYIPPGANCATTKSSELNISGLDKVFVNISDFKILIQNYSDKFVSSKFDLNDTFSNKLYIGASAIFHVALLSIFAFFMPPLGLTDANAAEKDQIYLMQQYLNASAERELEAKEQPDIIDDKNQQSSNEGGTGVRAKGEEGSMGNSNSYKTNKSYTIAGPTDNKDIHIAKERALRDATSFGLIGILNTGTGGDLNAPTAPWGRDDTSGNNHFSAMGNMWGDAPGEAYGSGGLGLSGIGEYGGGKGEGIGLGSIGTIGHGAGLGDKQGFGNGHGYLSNKNYKPKVPQVRIGTTTVTGKLPAEVIQRIVRQNYGRFRSCYEIGLRSNPSLQGRVAVRFVIGRDGSVSNVSNGGSDLPDQTVVQCVVRAYYGLSFPQPENGIVTVIYPIMFSAQ